MSKGVEFACKCWNCGRLNEMADEVGGNPEGLVSAEDHAPVVPSDGDVLTCVSCLEISIVDGEGGRRPTDDEYLEAMKSPVLRRLQEVAHALNSRLLEIAPGHFKQKDGIDWDSRTEEDRQEKMSKLRKGFAEYMEKQRV